MFECYEETYIDVLSKVDELGVLSVNKRTRHGVKTYPGGLSFSTNIRDGLLSVPNNRAYYPGSAAAEVAWQFMGTQDPSFILKHAPTLWEKFVENDKLETAYGYRWREHFGRDQIQLAVNELKNNHTNRQLYISAWDPAADGLGGPQPKNIPCPVGFAVSKVGNYLHGSVFIRSSDIVVGLPYDVMAYSLTLDAMAATVGCRAGSLHVTLANAHYYTTHEHIVKKSLEDRTLHGTTNVSLPRWSIDKILAKPDEYVAAVKAYGRQGVTNTWNPRPEVVL